jgi:hypothetical protein
MSKYLGDFGAGDTIDFKFTTFRPSTGAAFTLGGTPVISVYKDNSTTESTAGVTLTADFDARTGLNHVRITTSSDGAFYADGSAFECVITTGTVDSVSVVGSCVGRFTLRDQACLYPTVHARKLDVSAGGEAGLDWANVGSPTTTLGLSGTTISTSQGVASVSGNVTGSIGSVATGGITTASFAAGAINAAAVATGAIDADSLATDAVAEIADGVLARKLDSSGNETSVTTANERTVRSALRYLRNRVDISGSTLTVYQEDDGVTITGGAWTAALTTSAGLNPVTQVEPT